MKSGRRSNSNRKRRNFAVRAGWRQPLASPSRRSALHVELLEPRLVLAASFVISEFLADNSDTLLDNYGVASDWIEIHNTGDAAGNLLGYALTDDANAPAKWQFPSVTVPANGYLLVYASGMDDRDPLQPLHANFSLSKEGEYLGLHTLGGTPISVYAPAYPPQRANISEGLGQVVDVVHYVPPGAASQSLVPTASTDANAWKLPGFAPDASWTSGTTGVGFGQSYNGFLVRTYQANISASSPIGTTLDTIDEVLEMIGNPAAYTSLSAGNYPAVNFLNTGAGGHYTGDAAFPGQTNPTNYNHFATEARALVTIPTPGPWTFGTSSNEGFLLQVGEFEMERSGTGSNDAFETFHFAAPGVYELTLYNFERTGDAWLELYAAPGTFTTWNAANFDRVGDTAGGGLAVKSNLVGSSGGGIAQLLGTNLQAQMLGVNPSFYTRVPFNVVNPAVFDQLQLRMKYDDAFVAWLNGTEIARRNFTGAPQWNSNTPTARTGDEVLTYTDIDVSAFLSALVPGQNVLAIQGINVSASDQDVLVLPELIATDVQSTSLAFFTTPTPGVANVGGVAGFVSEPTFSVERGFYNAPFQVAIGSPTPGSQIYYTTNGDAPTQATGILYTAPITVSSTRVVRAAAFRSGYLESASVSESYIFLNDVIRQTPATTQAAGFPSTWGSLSTDYGMDPDVIGTFDANGNPTGGDKFGGVYAATIKNDLLSLPTISIVMDVDDMFGSAGIYTNSTQRGSAWERPASFEWINPDGSLKFQVNAGIRVQGGAFRSDGLTKKHSLRLLFKNEYGPGKLEYPIFGDDPGIADEFNTVVLRAGANDGYTWSSAQFTEQYTRDQFGRSLQAAMGHPAAHGEFAHLYINGVYWGLYNPVERPDNEFGASYVSGDPDNWDSIHVAETPSGDDTAWNAMFALAATAGSSTSAYMQLQGRNPDGAPNPAFAPLLDVDNYIDYIAMNAWGGNWDWPNKNYWAGRDRDPLTTTGFTFFTWDFENTMGNNLSRSPLNAATFDDLAKFTGSRSAGQPHTSLKTNAEYRLAFADHVYKLFFNGGVLTPANLIARYTAIADEVDRAIVAESARWGDSHFSTAPLTLADWTTERNWMLNTYLPQRSAIVMQELLSNGLYPSIVAPTFSKHGGQVTAGFDLAVTAPAGTIWYTLNGSDPRAVGGAVSLYAVQYTGALIDIPAALTVRARVLSGGVWSALNEAAFTVAAPADATNLRIVELHYNPAAQAGMADPADLEFIELLNPSSQPVTLDGVKITEFSSTPYAFPNGLILGPGQRLVVARTPSALQAAYGAGINVAAAGYADQNLSNGGETVALVGQLGNTLQSIAYDDEGAWPGAADGAGKSLEIVNPLGSANDPANWRASYYRGGSPGTAGLAPTIAGDSDGDGDVDGADMLALQRGLGTPQLQGSAAKGDADGDRDVDSADLALLRSRFGTVPLSTASASLGGAAVVLAPTTAAEQGVAVFKDDEWIASDLALPTARKPLGREARERAFGELPRDGFSVVSAWKGRPLAASQPRAPFLAFGAKPWSSTVIDAAYDRGVDPQVDLLGPDGLGAGGRRSPFD